MSIKIYKLIFIIIIIIIIIIMIIIIIIIIVIIIIIIIIKSSRVVFHDGNSYQSTLHFTTIVLTRSINLDLRFFRFGSFFVGEDASTWAHFAVPSC